MTEISITEFHIGKDNNPTSFWFEILTSFISLPLNILEIFKRNKKSYFDVNDSKWEDWKSISGTSINRKIVAETGFDLIIKFYRINIENQELNKAVNGKYFGTFYHETKYGVFLREFNNPNDWPISYLTFIDKSEKSIRRLKKINSSWIEWNCETINELDFNILTHLGEENSKGLKIEFPSCSKYIKK